MGIDVEIKCNTCDARLGDGNVSNNCLYVEPCPICVEKALDEGYDDGLKEGRNETPA